MAVATWAPPDEVAREEIVQTSEAVLSRPDLPMQVREDIFRIEALGLEWDIGSKVFEPSEPARGADGKKAGLFLLHGGAGDFRSLEPIARLLAGKYGYHVAVMTYPGQLYFDEPAHDWPDDTIHADGTVRTPIFLRGEPIPPDQYEVIQDRSDPAMRARMGTLFFARAKEGTPFYDRLAAAPFAMEEAMKAVCARNFPAGEYSVYVHGHSTGGPHVHMLLQRVENVVGLIGCENSPFGTYFSRMLNVRWQYPFNYMTVRTWRDLARYRGNELPPDAYGRLPWVMEDVLDEWEASKHRPNIKFQDLVQFDAQEQLEAGARASAARLKLGEAATEELVARYQAYPRPLQGPGTKPIPPLLYSTTIGSMDHRPERYREILLPALGQVDRPPKRTHTLLLAGVHSYARPEQDLPKGVAPFVADFWNAAIQEGFYLG